MIEVKDLHKNFGDIKAVDGVSFSLSRGEVLGFLGPNGAGKSTTMKMLCSFLTPDSGTATVCGFDVMRDSLALRESIGYLPENAPLYDEMTVISFLHFVCQARGVKDFKKAIERVVESCALSEVLHRAVGALSKGYRRRVGLAQALIHDPAVLILDEPTDGLDPNQKHQVRELITSLSHDKCIIISTHILEEVEAICNRLIIIDKGRMLVDSSPSKLRESEGGTLDEIFRKLTSVPLDPFPAGSS